METLEGKVAWRRLVARPWQWFGAVLARRRKRLSLVRKDVRLFEHAYATHYIPGETKPPGVGRPFLLRPLPLRPRGGIVLVHGYLAAPLETRALAEHLCRAGFAVYGVRLAGHGTAPEDVAGRPWEEWYDSVVRGVAIMETLTDRVVLCGFSIGGCLSLIGGARMPERISAAVSICAPLHVRRYSIKLAPSIVSINSLLEKMGAGRYRLDYIENNPENRHINYLRNPMNSLPEVTTVMAETERQLHAVTCPAMVVQASEDPTVHPDSGKEIFDKLGTAQKQLIVLERKRHGIINGEGSVEVFSRVAEFLRHTLEAPRPVAPKAPPMLLEKEEDADEDVPSAG